jgi:hypothetical protein
MDSKLDDDEDVFPYNGMPRRSYGQSQSQSQYYQQSSSSPFWQVVMRTLDVCTGPNFGLLVAVLVIVFLQFKSSLLNFFYNAMEDGWQQTLLECLYGLLELLRAYYQMACELIRSLRLGSGPRPAPTTIRSHGASATNGSVPPPLVILPIEDANAAMPVPTSRTRNRSDARFNATHESSARSPSPSTSSSSSLVPQAPLVQEEIEPAFLSEKDYPPGWLVYHPVLGVVAKEEADQYNTIQLGPGPGPSATN